jgi:hypothetical protein
MTPYDEGLLTSKHENFYMGRISPLGVDAEQVIMVLPFAKAPRSVSICHRIDQHRSRELENHERLGPGILTIRGHYTGTFWLIRSIVHYKMLLNWIFYSHSICKYEHFYFNIIGCFEIYNMGLSFD